MKPTLDDKKDKKMIKKAMRQHEAHDHPGKKFTSIKLKAGGAIRRSGRKS